MLAGLVYRPKLILFLALLFIEFLAVTFLLVTKPDLGARYTKTFLSEIPILNTSDNNSYWGAWRGGIQQIIQTPYIGIGPSGTRKTCINLPPSQPDWLPGKNYCGNHPHNFYIQLFAETGFIGLIFGIGLFFSIIKTCYQSRRNNPSCPMNATAFVIPFGLFFPIQQFGSFYGQWGNLFIWFAIGFAISQVQKYK